MTRMTTARSHLVDLHARDFCHCISRCVRCALLCGIDLHDGKSHEHRREWVEQGLLELAGLVAVGIHAYAVMSRHLHVVLRIDPLTAEARSPEEVARQWSTCFSPRRMAKPMKRAIS